MPPSRLVLALAALAPGCLPAPAPPAFGDPALAARLPVLSRAFAGRGPAHGPVALRYDVETPQGAWTRDVVLTPFVYAERRRRKDGALYAFGEDAAGAWLRVGAAPARAADDTWRAELRTQRALFDLSFLAPGARDHAAFLGAGPDDWELAFLPEGGSSLVFVVARASRRPEALDVHDAIGRLVACDDVRWTRRAGRMLPSEVRCTTAVGERDAASVSRFRLTSASPLSALPPWARVPPRPPAPVFDRPVEIAQTDVRSPSLDLAAPTGAHTRLVVDTGATHTVLDADAARALGVVPTGEAPVAYRPPWLPDHLSWMGVVDRLSIGGAVIDGARVQVTEGFASFLGRAGGDDAPRGLAGLDLLRRFVTEVDGPGRVVRLYPAEAFVPAPGAARIAVRRSRRSVEAPGAVRGVAEGSFVVDTGAPVEAVVTALELLEHHPRRRGSAASLGARDEAVSPDYWVEVPGICIGPFRFPSTPVVGRDRDRDRIGGSLGLVGMGLLRHLRVAYDLDHAALWALPGPSYHALRVGGLEVEDGPRGVVVVSRIVPGGSAEAAGLRPFDEVRSIDGRPVRGGADAVRLALGGRDAAPRHLRVGRGDAVVDAVIAVAR